MCFKLSYSSVEAAKRAHRRAAFRIRAYLCHSCDMYHVTNGDKGYNKTRDERRMLKHVLSGSFPLHLAPQRTLEEVTAIAERMRQHAS